MSNGEKKAISKPPIPPKPHCSNQGETSSKSFKVITTSSKDSNILRCKKNSPNENDSSDENCCFPPLGKALKSKTQEIMKKNRIPPPKPPKPSQEALEKARKRALEVKQRNENSLLEAFKNKNGIDDILYADVEGTESSIDYKEDDVSSMVIMNFKSSHESPALPEQNVQGSRSDINMEADVLISQNAKSDYVTCEKYKAITSNESSSNYHTADQGTSVPESVEESSLILTGDWDKMSSQTASNQFSSKKSPSPICPSDNIKPTSKLDSFPQSLDEKMQYFYEKLVLNEIEESIKDIYSNLQPPKLPSKPPRMKGSPIFITPLSELPPDLFPSSKLQEKSSQTMLTAIVKNPYLDSMPNVYQTLIIKPRSPPPRPPPPNWSNLPKLKDSSVPSKVTKIQPLPQRPPRSRRRSRTVEVIYPPERTNRKRSISLNVINSGNEPTKDLKSLYTSVNKERDKSGFLDNVQMRPLPAPPPPPRTRIRSPSSRSSPCRAPSPRRKTKEDVKICGTFSIETKGLKDLASQINLPPTSSNSYSSPNSCAFTTAPISNLPPTSFAQDTNKNDIKDITDKDNFREEKFMSHDSFSELPSATSYFVYSHSLQKRESSSPAEQSHFDASYQAEKDMLDLNNCSLMVSPNNQLHKQTATPISDLGIKVILDKQKEMSKENPYLTETHPNVPNLDTLSDEKRESKENYSSSKYLKKQGEPEGNVVSQSLNSVKSENDDALLSSFTEITSLQEMENKVCESNTNVELEEKKGVKNFQTNLSENTATDESLEIALELICDNTSETKGENISNKENKLEANSLNELLKTQDTFVALSVENDKTNEESDKESSCVALSILRDKTIEQHLSEKAKNFPNEIQGDNLQKDIKLEKETLNTIKSNDELATSEKDNLNHQNNMEESFENLELPNIKKEEDISGQTLLEKDVIVLNVSKDQPETLEKDNLNFLIKNENEQSNIDLKTCPLEKEDSSSKEENEQKFATQLDKNDISNQTLLEKDSIILNVSKDHPEKIEEDNSNFLNKMENEKNSIDLKTFSLEKEGSSSKEENEPKIAAQLDENANVPSSFSKSKSLSPELGVKRQSSIKRISRSIFYDETEEPCSLIPHSKSPSPSYSHKSWNSESDISFGGLGENDSITGNSKLSKNIKLRSKNGNSSHNKERRSSEFYCELEDSNYNLELPKEEKESSPQESTDKSDTPSATTSSYSEMSLSSEESEDESFFSTEEDKKQRKIYYIAREIMTSEEKFVDVLKLLNDFRSLIEKANKDSNILPEEYVSKLLANFPQLQKLNENLLQEFKDRIKNWKEHRKICDVIVKIGPFLKLYSSYIKDFDLLYYSFDDACKKYPYFRSLVHDFEQSPQCQKLALKHFMLKPIQRIPQYKLLLQQYLNNLQEDNPDYKDAKIALDIVSNVADHANTVIEKGDNFNKMLSIQNSIIGHPEIVKPGREFIKEGELWKLSRKGEQPRRFILFSDLLLYLTPTQNLYKINHSIPLTGMKVHVPVQHENEFCIISRSRSIQLAARSQEEQESWVTALKKAIEENASKRSTFIKPKEAADSSSSSTAQLGMEAPVWIPDSRVTMCQVCTSEFSLAFRRHHCRACGKVVCALCSSNKAPLPYLQNHFSRVCDECFPQLCHDQPSTSSLALSQQSQKRPRVLREVCANDQGSTISGYLYRFETRRNVWKRFWFVIKNKVLYTYKASEDVAALESMPLLGFTVKTFNESFQGIESDLVFQILQASVIITFHATSKENASRWVKALHEAAILE